MKKRTPKIKKKTEEEPKRISYRDGAEGFIKWCEDFIYIPIPAGDSGDFVDWVPISGLSTKPNPITGRTSREMWESFCQVARECLKMKNGRFKYRLIIFCWMRGEGKSLFACLIQLWKFFNFPRQQIMLGANSKDQVKFVHFDIMKDIIQNSPGLIRIVGQRNVQEKQIQLKNHRGEVASLIRSISSFSGIVSNITGYTFSEIFDMKNPKFFTQLDGSIRNIPNALGVIDSTVSSKEHILFRLFEKVKQGKLKTTYFSHRSSVMADSKDFWNPEMTPDQLNEYQEKFPPSEFAMYFKNTWESGESRLFSREEVLACRYVGIHNSLGEQKAILDLLKRYFSEKDKMEEDNYLLEMASKNPERSVEDILQPLIPTSKLYSLQEHQHPKMATMEDLKHLSDKYDTNFAILGGADRADPQKKDITQGARTIVSIIAKGLPGSRSNPHAYLDPSVVLAKRFIYFQLHLEHIIFSDINSIQRVLEEAIFTFGSLETFCSERWGMWDIENWCGDNEVLFEPITASYDRQKAGFTEFYYLVRDGRFKCPEIAIRGSKEEDILLEEMGMFDHSAAQKFYGSPEKSLKYGVQDDVMFSNCWAVYGGRMLSVEDFPERDLITSFGEFYPNKNLVGNYK